MQVEPEAQAATHANTLHFLTTASLPTVGEKTPDLLILSNRYIAHVYDGCCHWWCLLFTKRAALQLL